MSKAWVLVAQRETHEQAVREGTKMQDEGRAVSVFIQFNANDDRYETWVLPYKGAAL